MICVIIISAFLCVLAAVLRGNSRLGPALFGFAWLLYVVFFHLNSGKSSRGLKATAHSFVFFSLLATFFAVNLLPGMKSALHSYF